MTRSHSLVADAGDLFIENAEKLKFCFLKIEKSNYERLVLLTIVTKTAGSDMPAVGPARNRTRQIRIGNVMNKPGQGARSELTRLRSNGRITFVASSETLLPIICGENSGVKDYASSIVAHWR